MTIGTFKRAIWKATRCADVLLCKTFMTVKPRFRAKPVPYVVYSTQYYQPKTPERQSEINNSILFNTSFDWIDKAILFCEGDGVPPFFARETLSTIRVSSRLSFGTAFIQFKQQNHHPDTIIIFANSDIKLTNDVIKLLPWIGHSELVALTRYESPSDILPFLVTSILPGLPSITQDTWIFRSSLLDQIDLGKLMEIPLGIPGCESLLVGLLSEQGISVSNPCLGIRTIHVHQSSLRSYSEIDRLCGVYGFPKTTTLSQFRFGRRYQIVNKPFYKTEDSQAKAEIKNVRIELDQ